ncbi:MAG: PQQ-binding-like beta-propeller repeat protein [Candidatus Solibacter usitatus]|nr:PQQ-binding-like beta-propeller repeat protein [Candidatus Solibacter usitatus]
MLGLFLSISLAMYAADAEAGRKQYSTRCAHCHGADGNGGERGQRITNRLDRSDTEVMALIDAGLPARGMPAIKMEGGEVRDLVAFLRSIQTTRNAAVREKIRLANGAVIEGIVRNRSTFDMQVETGGGIALLRRAGESWREAKSASGWPTYNGVPGGNRFSELKKIDTTNVARLAPRWIYSIPGMGRLQVTPVVADGVMYVTAVNQVHALDSGTGRVIWIYRRPRSSGLVGDAASGINRGVAIAGNRVFTVTDNAHLIALNRLTGALLWDVEMADSKQHYGATSAPLAVKDLVVSGVSGGDEGARGFLSSYKQSTGERVWQFYTVPARGEPLAETWKGSALEHGCAAPWLTGSYDASLDLLLWAGGNPCPDYNGDERQGDNLYSNTALAMRPESGTLVWHYQFTPHDLHDWDAAQPLLSIDAPFGGRMRKLLLQANRNGFFYVLDRENGKLLLAKPFVKKLTWASGIDAAGRPMVNPGSIPTLEGVTACPAVEGATNWMSSAYHPGTGLFYVATLEKCNIYIKRPGKWEQGKSYYDGDTRRVPGEIPRRILRAINIQDGRIVWEHEQEGPGTNWGGVLATAGGLIFFCDDSGAFAAADAKSGKVLWHFPLNEAWKASPMTYEMDGRQYVAVASGGSIVAFGQ